MYETSTKSCIRWQIIFFKNWKRRYKVLVFGRKNFTIWRINLITIIITLKIDSTKIKCFLIVIVFVKICGIIATNCEPLLVNLFCTHRKRISYRSFWRTKKHFAKIFYYTFKYMDVCHSTTHISNISYILVKLEIRDTTVNRRLVKYFDL